MNHAIAHQLLMSRREKAACGDPLLQAVPACTPTQSWSRWSVLALYPPFLVLAVVHKYYTAKQELLIFNRLKVLPIAPIGARELTIA